MIQLHRSFLLYPWHQWPLLGLLLTLAAAMSWAIGNVASRRAAVASGLSMTVWSALFVPLPLFILALAIDGPSDVGAALTHLTLANVLSTAYTAYLASLVGYGIWNTLLARHPTALVVPFTLLVPAVGMLTAWLVQGEQPGPAEAIGGLALLVGVAVTAISRSAFVAIEQPTVTDSAVDTGLSDPVSGSETARKTMPVATP